MKTELVLGVMWLMCQAVAEEDYQQWSEMTYIDDRFSFYCNDTINHVFLNPIDMLVWRRHGQDAAIKDDDQFELGDSQGITNMQLTIKRVTDEMSGIYFCEVYDSPGGRFVARIVKGLNIGGHKYHDYLDKYRENIITGVISAASVLVLVLGICAVDHFRYVSDEERLERRAAKEKRLRNGDASKGDTINGAYDNIGMSAETFDVAPYEQLNDKQQHEVNTQL
ncbi:hypothetical protein EGW08_013930 [Elysia chlorotica]|uniref:Ig-like domain-containing protein n=1 Tax=Elysia chlorotica TaxID=188477 RepID=A0A433T9P6_ELYCH|nr:hypothetical protein EGW08_013930 [Elysia chlorotica]